MSIPGLSPLEDEEMEGSLRLPPQAPAHQTQDLQMGANFEVLISVQTH